MSATKHLLVSLTYETLPGVAILSACRSEIDALPIEVRVDLADALARLDNGSPQTIATINLKIRSLD